MTPLVFCLLIFFSPTPELATPEAVAKAFGTLHLERENARTKRDSEFQSVGKALYDARGKQQLEAMLARSRELTEPVGARPLADWQVGKVFDHKDGTKTVVCTAKRKRSLFLEQRVQVNTETVTFHVRVSATKGGWALAGFSLPCPTCQSKGHCDGCKGLGKTKATSCPLCKGEPTCKACKGTKVRASKLGSLAADRRKLSVEREKTYALSSPRETAQAFVDVCRRRWLLRREIGLADEHRLAAAMRALLAPAAAKVVDAQEAKWLRKGAGAVQELYVVGKTIQGRGQTQVLIKSKVTPEWSYRLALSEVDGAWKIQRLDRACVLHADPVICQPCKQKAQAKCSDCETCELCVGGWVKAELP